MKITADQFVTRSGRSVLTNDGQQGMGGEPRAGSTTERKQGQVAAAIYANCAELDNNLCDL